MTNKRCFSIAAQSLALMTSVWLIGCVNNPLIIDDVPSDWNAEKIVMRQTGGIAGVSRIITVEEQEDSTVVVSVNERTNQRVERTVSHEDLEKLWQTLEADDIFSLPTNQEMLEKVYDGFSYEITVQRGGKRNRFSVYAPEQLAESGEKRYNDIVQAIKQFAESQNTENFVIADLPINDISVNILESFPLQIHIVIDGFLRDSCTTLNEIAQERDGNTINVHITTKRPKDALCAQVIKEIQKRIPLEGGFLPGRYNVIVNGVEREFEI